ncbi:glycosyltransferase family 4 protein [Dyadobacter sp. Leaf189]|uniref:glycosyltransferase family 4 protein n=1 Tax=Dyadobacter sp. Leaf189 TaxID=1736295 RepID=UPI00070080C7|nr:glycosyltransferase family 4 protein [Dyadobacter sp. Leaf189]KQS30667.1 hypothetical protein ASG33_09745 [Dyadobacter sp. Leaf189]
MEKKIHVVYLTNVPAPYRERMHELLEQESAFSYTVVYCAQLEPNRSWKLDYGKYARYFLSEASKTFKHNNPSVWSLLNVIRPDVMIITGFNPTMLYGFIWAMLKGCKFIVSLDGTYDSEKDFSIFHKWVRKLIFPFTNAFIGPSRGSAKLFRSYGIKDSDIFKSTLCIDNNRFSSSPIKDREFDIMFSGQLIERKMPGFFAEVACRLNKVYPGIKILVVGDGPLRKPVLDKLDSEGLDYVFTGFLDQHSLASCYSKSKLFLFPTLQDPWGIVANEACASGTPVITCANAGAADDLVIDQHTGLILPLDEDVWVEQIATLLNNPDRIQQYANNALSRVRIYNHNQAAQGVIDAVMHTVPNTFAGTYHEI